MEEMEWALIWVKTEPEEAKHAQIWVKIGTKRESVVSFGSKLAQGRKRAQICVKIRLKSQRATRFGLRLGLKRQYMPRFRQNTPGFGLILAQSPKHQDLCQDQPEKAKHPLILLQNPPRRGGSSRCLLVALGRSATLGRSRPLGHDEVVTVGRFLYGGR